MYTGFGSQGFEKFRLLGRECVEMLPALASQQQELILNLVEVGGMDQGLVSGMGGGGNSAERAGCMSRAKGFREPLNPKL